MNENTKTARVLTAFQNGEELTAKQIAARFRVGNPGRVVHYLRENGYPIYSNARTNAKGETKVKYRLGTPTREMIAAGFKALGAATLTRV